MSSNDALDYDIRLERDNIISSMRELNRNPDHYYICNGTLVKQFFYGYNGNLGTGLNCKELKPSSFASLAPGEFAYLCKDKNGGDYAKLVVSVNAGPLHHILHPGRCYLYIRDKFVDITCEVGEGCDPILKDSFLDDAFKSRKVRFLPLHYRFPNLDIPREIDTKAVYRILRNLKKKPQQFYICNGHSYSAEFRGFNGKNWKRNGPATSSVHLEPGECDVLYKNENGLPDEGLIVSVYHTSYSERTRHRLREDRFYLFNGGEVIDITPEIVDGYLRKPWSPLSADNQLEVFTSKQSSFEALDQVFKDKNFQLHLNPETVSKFMSSLRRKPYRVFLCNDSLREATFEGQIIGCELSKNYLTLAPGDSGALHMYGGNAADEDISVNGHVVEEDQFYIFSRGTFVKITEEV